MKPTYFIVVLAFLAIVVIILTLCLNEPRQTPDVINTLATSTAISTAEMKIADYEYLRTITPEILKQQPGWNPTMEVEGMVRVEDNNPELEISDYPSHVFARSWKNPRNETISTFIVKYLEPEVSTEACSKYGITGSHPYIGKYQCITTPLELFNEFIIYSTDGEVLHKFKLKKGYSLISNVYFQGEGDFINLHPYIQDDKYLLSVGITKREGSGVDGKYTTYQINLITGEITKVEKK